MKIPGVSCRTTIDALPLLAAALLLFAPGVLAAQTGGSGHGAGPATKEGTSQAVVHRLTGPIVLDGVVVNTTAPPRTSA